MSDDKILMNFSNIILSYAVNATIHLGLSPDPATGQISIDLNRAKDLIDILDVLKDKTKGNLISLPVEGGILEVSFTEKNGTYKNVFLKGPAAYVFKGEITI